MDDNPLNDHKHKASQPDIRPQVLITQGDAIWERYHLYTSTTIWIFWRAPVIKSQSKFTCKLLLAFKNNLRH